MFNCGDGFDSELRSDDLKTDGEHVLYVRGIDEFDNVGETILTKWIVGAYFVRSSRKTSLHCAS